MQGSSGGGGGFVSGFILGSNPGLIVPISVLTIAGLIVYGIVDHHDQQYRAPFADDIVASSLEKCFNAQTHPEFYKEILKKELMKVWSSDLEAFTKAKKDMGICIDPALKTFEISEQRVDVGTEYKDIFRVMGLVYSKDGHETLVYRPYETVNQEYTSDTHPDMPLDLDTVMKAVLKMTPDTYQHALPDGTKVSAFVQRDGTVEVQGSNNLKANDGSGWADAVRMDEIAKLYSFAAPSPM